MARRTAKKLEPIQYDELLNNSSMEGLVSFINYRPEATSSTLVESAATDISSTVDEASADVAASPGPADIMLSYSTLSELPPLADAPLSSTVDIPSADDEGASAADGSTVDVNGSIRHHSAVDL